MENMIWPGNSRANYRRTPSARVVWCATLEQCCQRRNDLLTNESRSAPSIE